MRWFAGRALWVDAWFCEVRDEWMACYYTYGGYLRQKLSSSHVMVEVCPGDTFRSVSSATKLPVCDGTARNWTDRVSEREAA